MKYLYSKKVLIIFCAFLFFLPFFWFSQNQVDMGGDSSRLYYFDPVSYFNNMAVYGIAPEGIRAVTPNQYFIPFLVFLIGIYKIFHSPFILTCFINGVKVCASFLFVYLILKEFLNTTLFKKNTIVIELSSY